MGGKIKKLVFWAPRVMAMLFICFLSLFSLDVFAPGVSFFEAVVGLLIHNIPAFMLLVALLIAWKKEIAGGVIFMALGIALAVFTHFESMVISLPAVVIGVLFLSGGLLSNKRS